MTKHSLISWISTFAVMKSNIPVKAWKSVIYFLCIKVVCSTLQVLPSLAINLSMKTISEWFLFHTLIVYYSVKHISEMTRPQYQTKIIYLNFRSGATPQTRSFRFSIYVLFVIFFYANTHQHLMICAHHGPLVPHTIRRKPLLLNFIKFPPGTSRNQNTSLLNDMIRLQRDRTLPAILGNLLGIILHLFTPSELLSAPSSYRVAQVARHLSEIIISEPPLGENHPQAKAPGIDPHSLSLKLADPPQCQAMKTQCCFHASVMSPENILPLRI